jgi:putative oxidoreductase
VSAVHAGDQAVLMFRGCVGLVFLAHGCNHVFGGGKIAGTGRWFTRLGTRPGIVHAWLASLTELGTGVLLLARLATPLAAAGVIGTMLVAWVTNHAATASSSSGPARATSTS